MTLEQPLVEVKGLCFSYQDRVIFDDVDLDIYPRQITAIMGPSGTGKTTLLKLIGGQLQPSAGTIHINGQDVHRLSRNKLFKLRQQLGLLFQSGALLTDMNVFENVAFPLREHTQLPEIMIRDLVLMNLEAVGLRGARELMPNQLSGGMARRVALARAVALDPMMVMYDEPFTGQDPISMGVLVELIEKLNKALDMTSIIVSHDVAETVAIADFIYLLADGKVAASGSPSDLRRARSPWVTQFMQGKPDGPVPFHYPAPSYSVELMDE
jgi:phospholipid/cholesterol/gamma-HCH transport system ATP-binding protein